MQSQSRPERAWQLVRAWRPERAWQLAPRVLRVVAEAGWLTVLYAGWVVAVEHRLPAMGPVEIGLLVTLGLAVVWAGRRTGELGPFMLLLGIALGGLLGWLADGAARDLFARDLTAALGTHTSGWLGAVAVLRGAFLMRRPDRAAHMEGVLAWVLPSLAVVWAFGVTVSRPDQVTDFILLALWGTVLFIGGAVITLGLSRLEVLEPGIADIRLHRRLRHLVLAAGLAVLPLALPFAILSGLPVEELFGPIIGPVRAVIGLIALFFGYIVEAIINAVTVVIRPSPELLERIRLSRVNPGEADTWQRSELVDLAVIGVVIFVMLVLSLLIIELARWLLGKRTQDGEDGDFTVDDIERSIVIPPHVLQPAAAGAAALGSRRVAHDAVSAYLGALRELDGHPPFARVASETPGRHAARVNRQRMPGAPDLARLAADYQLARYAGRSINAAEDRRALRRLDRLRRLLRR
ncbi:hypothetical protein BH24CHL5_BH24CHL5_11020 [soil metagenome]